MSTKSYLWLSNLGFFLTGLCLIIVIPDVVNGNNMGLFLLSLVVLIQLFWQRQFNQDYQQTIIEINDHFQTKVSFLDSEKIVNYRIKQINLQLKHLISQIEAKNKQNFYQLKQAIIISQRQSQHLRKDLANQVSGLQEQIKALNITKFNDSIENNTVIIEISEKLIFLQEKIEEQKSYLAHLVNRKYQAGIKQIQELLIPLHEKQNYLEELQQIRRQQMKVEIRQLNIALNQVKQQQNEDYLHLNQLILQPLKQRQNNLEDYQENMIKQIEEKIDNLELSLTQTVLDYQENIWQLNQLISPQTTNNQAQTINQTINIFSGERNYQTAINYDNNVQIDPQSLNISPNQLDSSNSNLQQLSEIESLIQREVENCSQQIESLLESFSLQQQNLDRLLEDKTKTYSQNFDAIYHNMNQINQLIMSLESKYQSFTNLNRKIHGRVKNAIAQLYHQELKPMKDTLTDVVNNEEYLINKQGELEDLYDAVKVEFKTEINKVKDEIFTELGRLNDIVNAI